MEILTNDDAEYYLQNGKLTSPFLSNEYVLEKVMIDYNYRIQHNMGANIICSLYNWISYNVKYIKDKEQRVALKFQRTAKEIWEDKTSTGCTDYAILFATFARQIKIPTTILHTAEYNWVNKLINNDDYNIHLGHSFCECFINNEWILVDPTCRKIEKMYDPNIIELSYTVNGSKKFLPYFRGLDLGKKQTIKEHNEDMDIKCYEMFTKR